MGKIIIELPEDINQNFKAKNIDEFLEILKKLEKRFERRKLKEELPKYAGKFDI